MSKFMLTAGLVLASLAGVSGAVRADQMTYTGTNNGVQFSVTISYSGNKAVGVVGGYYGANPIFGTLLGVSQFDDQYADFDIWQQKPPPPLVPSPSPIGAGYFSDAAGNVVIPEKGKPFYVRFR